jgi:hypothetical protein
MALIANNGVYIHTDIIEFLQLMEYCVENWCTMVVKHLTDFVIRIIKAKQTLFKSESYQFIAVCF